MDDRGVGCSGGGPLEQVPGSERANDTRAGLHYLASRSDIDPRRLGLLGISEGANIALLLASTDPSIRAIVTLAASATPGWDVYVSQQRHLARNDIFTDRERERCTSPGRRPALGNSHTWRCRVECDDPALHLHGLDARPAPPPRPAGPHARVRGGRPLPGAPLPR